LAENFKEIAKWLEVEDVDTLVILEKSDYKNDLDDISGINFATQWHMQNK
jgi:hypothetical protein